MKFLLITALLMSSAFADHHEGHEGNLEEAKTMIAGKIDQKIALLQTHKSCVQAAATKEALKVCRDSNKEAMGKLREEMKGERKAWKESKKEKKKK